MNGMGLGRCVVGWCTVAFLVGPIALPAQETGDQDAEARAVAVIEQLFDAMRGSDSSAVRGLFADGVTEFRSSFTSQDAEPTIGVSKLEDFLEALGNAVVATWDEQIVVRDVIVDDNLVTVVTPYAFYFDGNLSHCGVNVFLVAKTGEDWKIVSLVDTRRQRGCEGWLDE